MLPLAAFVIADVGCEVQNGFDCGDEAVRISAIGGAVAASVFMGALGLHMHLFEEQWRPRRDGPQPDGGAERLTGVDVESFGGSDSTAQLSDDSSSSSELLPEQERSASRSSDVDESSEQDASASASA